MGLLDVGLKAKDRKLLKRLLALAELLVNGKQVVIRISVEDKIKSESRGIGSDATFISDDADSNEMS